MSFFVVSWGDCENELFCTSDILILEKDIKIGIYSGVINICILSCGWEVFFDVEKRCEGGERARVGDLQSALDFLC